MTPPIRRRTPTGPTTPTASTPTPDPQTATPTRPIRSDGRSCGGDETAATDAGREALGRCVSEPAAFLADAFGAEPQLRRGAGSFGDLLSLDDVDRALTGSGLRQPAFRLVRDGEPVDPRSYTRLGRTGRHQFSDLIDTGRVLDLFAGGATVVLQSLHRWWPPLARFCGDLELALGHPLQANAYLTPPGAAGLTPHHDTHDVFVLQVAGVKHWVVRTPVVAAPLAHHRSIHELAAAQPVTFETDLDAGDALYLPRGFVHSAASQEGTSLHLTLGVLATTVHDVLRRVIDRAGDEAAFRASLPAGYAFDRDTAERSVKAALSELMGWLERLDAADVAAEVTEEFFARRTPLLDGQLAEIAALDRIDDRTLVYRRAHGPVAVRHQDDGRLRLTLGDRRLLLPGPLEPAVRRLLDGNRRPVGDLADLLDADSRRVLVRRLVQEGVLRTDTRAGTAGG
jgi:lysine-specific demethylase/histidyl-hydroxylase NO66